jgi:hypothetical protein
MDIDQTALIMFAACVSVTNILLVVSLLLLKVNNAKLKHNLTYTLLTLKQASKVLREKENARPPL